MELLYSLVWIWRVVIVNEMCKFMQFTELFKIQKTFSIPEMDNKLCRIPFIHTTWSLYSFLLSNGLPSMDYYITFNPNGYTVFDWLSEKWISNLNWIIPRNQGRIRIKNGQRIQIFRIGLIDSNFIRNVEKNGSFVAHPNVNL